VLFRPGARFRGLPREGFEAFQIPGDDERRREIIAAFHPPLRLLAEDLLDRLGPLATEPLHEHLPRLDWPRGYRPFCTWLALSREAQGYQAGGQLNVGVHADQVSLRLGWDTAADAFGRFEFLARHGAIGRELKALAAENDLAFRVYARAEWPRGSARVFESPTDLHGSFDQLRQSGMWWEIGRRYDVPAELDFVCSPALGEAAAEVLGALLRLYERTAGG
jgi:hypothetical protein